MNIIFGKEQLANLDQKYTVLELDTLQIGENGPVVTAYCAVEAVPLEELVDLEKQLALHQQLLDNYKARKWPECQLALSDLITKWGGEVDSFYHELADRIMDYIANDPGTNWTGIIIKR